MKKGFTTTCLIFALIIVYGQKINFTVKSGEEIKFKVSDFATNIHPLGLIDGNAYFLFLPYQAGGGFEISLNGKNHFIGKYTLDGNLVKKSEIELTQNKKDLEFESALKLNNQLFVFSSFQNKKEKKHYLFVQNFNPTTVELVNNIKPIAELSYADFSKFDYASFWYDVSPDSSKVLVFYTLYTKKGEVLRSGFNVYGNDFTLIWKREDAKLSFSEGIFEYYRLKVDNEGGVYILGKKYKDKENYYDAAHFSYRGFFSKDTYYTDMPNYTFELNVYLHESTDNLNYRMTLPGKFIRSINFTTSDKRSVTCYGMYSVSGKISVVGSFCFDLDLTTEKMSQLNTSEFGKELLSKGLDDAELKRFRRSIDNKQEWDPYDYLLSDLLTRENGDKYFIAEQFLSGYKRTNRMEGTRMVTIYENIYLHNDLFVVNIGADNQIRRTDKITKRQYWLSTNRFNSYASVEKNNALYFLYNNFTAKDALFTNVEIGDSYLTKLNENGEQVKEIYKKKTDDKEPFPLFRTAIKVADGSLLYGLFPFNNRRYQFQRIILKD